MATTKAPRKPRREPMSRVDTAWLRMERPTNPMMITGVLMFDEPMSIATLRQVVKKRFLAYPRFLQKAVDTPAGAAWLEDEHFDLDWHVCHYRAAGARGQEVREESVRTLRQPAGVFAAG